MKLREVFLDNWGIKLLSLCISLTLWFYVTSKGKTEMTLTVPLELRNVPQSLAVVGNVTGTLEVRVQGQELALRDITIGKRVFCALDLSTATPGENVLPITPDEIRRPSGVSITHLSPTEVRVRLDPIIQKTLRVRAKLRGDPAPGFRVVKVVVSPRRLTVVGAESAVRSLAVLRTLPIDIEGARESMTVDPRIDYQGRQVKIVEKDISVTIVIERTGQ